MRNSRLWLNEWINEMKTKQTQKKKIKSNTIILDNKHWNWNGVMTDIKNEKKKTILQSSCRERSKNKK